MDSRVSSSYAFTVFNKNMKNVNAKSMKKKSFLHCWNSRLCYREISTCSIFFFFFPLMGWPRIDLLLFLCFLFFFFFCFGGMERYLSEEFPACSAQSAASAALETALLSISQCSRRPKYGSTSLLSYKFIGLQTF